MSAALLCLGHGLSGSLVSVTANAAEFGTDVTGFVMAGYSAGLLISTFITPRLVKSVGHVRTFSGLASIVSTAVLLFPLWVDPLFWFVLRLISGLCVSGMYIVCESWLNSASSNRNRGQMLSIYMIVTYGSLGAGQLLLNVTDTSGFVRFTLVSCLLSLVAGAADPVAVRSAERGRGPIGVGRPDLAGLAAGGAGRVGLRPGAKRLLCAGRRVRIVARGCRWCWCRS